MKFHQSSKEILELLSQKMGCGLVVVSLVNQIDAGKAGPKQLENVCLFLQHLINVCTFEELPFKELLFISKSILQNQNQGAKQAALNLLKIIYAQRGSQILKQLLDIPLNTLKMLQQEFEKVVIINPNVQAITKQMLDQEMQQSALQVQQQPSPSPSKAGKAGCQNAVAPQQPKIDISAEMGKIIKKMNDVNSWRQRKDGHEDLDLLIEKLKVAKPPQSFQSNILSELTMIYKARLQDSNKAVQKGYIQSLGKLIDFAGQPMKIFSKQMIGILFQSLQDKQPQLRSDIIAVIDKIAEKFGFDFVYAYIPPYLASPSPELVTELLAWTIRWHENLDQCENKQQWVQPILSCLAQKSKEIRVLAEQLLEHFVQYTSVQPFYNHMKDMKPAIVEQLRNVLQKYSSVCPGQRPDEPAGQQQPQLQQQQSQSQLAGLMMMPEEQGECGMAASMAPAYRGDLAVKT